MCRSWGRAAVERHEVGSGAIYTWRRQAMSGALSGVPARPQIGICRSPDQRAARAAVGAARRGVSGRPGHGADRHRAAFGCTTDRRRRGRRRGAVARDQRAGAMITQPTDADISCVRRHRHAQGLR